MKKFNDLKVAVQKQFKKMSEGELFRVDVDKDILWNTYLDSFPEGTNEIYRERREYDCQCCKQFIRAIGNVVAIIDNKKVSIWDIEVGGQFQPVVEALSNLVKSSNIDNIFCHNETFAGTDFNHQLLEDNTSKKWEHFYCKIPDQFVKRGIDIGSYISNANSNKDVFKRSLEEITNEAIETVIELIDQNSLYRGAEHKSTVELLETHKKAYDKIESEEEKDNYCWKISSKLGGASKIRNTVIGTLLTDISEGEELDKAVKGFESKVAPTNYKRPTALITKSMIANAQKKVEELGIENSLHRRYAVTEDITINNVLFADRSVKKVMNVFDELAENVSVNIKNMKKVEEVDINTFVDKILPKAESIELLFENKHVNNLMSLIAPVHDDSKHIFKWNNNFSWAYNGEVADSIKERVKKAGGNVEGFLRCSLSWFNHDDLDIHVIEPNGNEIYFSNKGRKHPSSGILDVDMNAGCGTTRNAVENITWTNKSKIQEGKYKLFVHNYALRETIDIGFDVEIEYEGEIYNFHYDKKVPDDKNVIVAEFEYTHKDGFKIIKSLPSTQTSKEMWNISTQKFHKVSMIMNSPNHWDGEKTGNKHWFFILDKCKNDKKARGFFNEFLNENLTEHRKVFEVLGSKLKTEISDNQLSGLGFSSTQKNYVLCKVTGSFSRTIKITF